MDSTYQVIARRWRPKSFSELVGQDHIVRTLSNAIQLGRTAHAYLFVGPKGTGKTSTARLFAQALNCEGGPSIQPYPQSPICQAIMHGRCMDVIEIDGASNNSVDQIRDLRQDCQYAPSQCKYKIYIIDEVHMLSTAAFNALLKVLEEPPPHVKFIFATTESEKVLPTIVSRCQRFEFKPISDEQLIEKLAYIVAQEGEISISTSALQAIARLADGGMRDAQSILDQLIAFCGKNITQEDVIKVYGLVSQDALNSLAAAILEPNYQKIIEYAQTFIEEGADILRITLDLQKTIRSYLIESIKGHPSPVGTQTPDSYIRILDSLKNSQETIKKGLSDRVNFEIALLKAAEHGRSRAIDGLIKKLSFYTSPPPGAETKVLKREENTEARASEGFFDNSLSEEKSSTPPWPEKKDNENSQSKPPLESYIQRLPTSTQSILQSRLRADFKATKTVYLDKLDK